VEGTLPDEEAASKFKRTSSWSSLEAPGNADVTLTLWDFSKVSMSGYRVVKPPFPEADYVLYNVTVTETGGRCYTIEKRFSQFERLHQELLEAGATLPGGKALEPMPPKRWLKTSSDTCDERMRGFQRILDQCVKLEHSNAETIIQFLLEASDTAPAPASPSGTARLAAASTYNERHNTL